jgi:hypothetical protein
MENVQKQNCIEFCFKNFVATSEAVSKFITGEKLYPKYIDDNSSCLIYIFPPGKFNTNNAEDKATLMSFIENHTPIFKGSTFYAFVNDRWRYVMFNHECMRDEYWEPVRQVYLQAGFKEIKYERKQFN